MSLHHVLILSCPTVLSNSGCSLSNSGTRVLVCGTGNSCMWQDFTHNQQLMRLYNVMRPFCLSAHGYVLHTQSIQSLQHQMFAHTRICVLDADIRVSSYFPAYRSRVQQRNILSSECIPSVVCSCLYPLHVPAVTTHAVSQSGPSIPLLPASVCPSLSAYNTVLTAQHKTQWLLQSYPIRMLLSVHTSPCFSLACVPCHLDV